jgi:hypothetical protein
MSTIGDQGYIEQVTRNGQIMVGALVAGVLLFLTIAVPVGPLAPHEIPFLTYAAVAFTALEVPLSFVVPSVIAKQNRRAIAAGTWTPPAQSGRPAQGQNAEALKTDAGKLATVYQMQLILGAALTEGAAFFAGVAYLLEKNPIALGLALLLVGGLVARFPTTIRVERWIAEQQERLTLERQAGV